MSEASGVSFALLRAKASASPGDSTSTTPAIPGPVIVGHLSNDIQDAQPWVKLFIIGSLILQGQQHVQSKHGQKLSGFISGFLTDAWSQSTYR